MHKLYAPLKRNLPKPVSEAIRGLATAFATPVVFSWRSGHFRSSLRHAAVDAAGAPNPWYTFPAIQFLQCRDYRMRTVLEFGGGQSTVWWAKRSHAVFTFEGDPGWHHRLARMVPDNVKLFSVSDADPARCVADVESVLANLPEKTFDVVAIDGLWRGELAAIAQRVLGPGGAIIVDNSEGYRTYELYRESGLSRADFHGHAPGVLLPHCTSVFFRHDSFLFSADVPIVPPS